MSGSFVSPSEPVKPLNEVTWARGRRTDRTYISRTFALDWRSSQDYGQRSRFVTKVFDEQLDEQSDHASDLEWTEEVVDTTPGGRKQIRVQVARHAGRVREIQIQRVPTSGDAAKLENILTLRRNAANRLIELVRNLQYIPVEGGEDTIRLDDQTIREFFADPEAMLGLYSRDPREVPRADPERLLGRRRGSPCSSQEGGSALPTASH